MATTYTFKVTGRGHFPFDMLRYDACWPAGSDDAAKLGDPQGAEEHRTMRTITLRSNSKPTFDRWSSFMWSADRDVKR